MLLGIHLAESGPITGLQLRQRGLLGIGIQIVGALLIQGQEAGEGHALTGGTEHPAAAANVGRHGIQHSICHLAGDEPGPDQLIQLVLVGGQAAAQALGLQLGIGGTDGFVGILCILLGAEGTGFGRLEVTAKATGDKAAGRSQRLVGDAQRVGTHIGDQTGEAQAFQLHAFIQLLCHRHGAAGGHSQLTGGLLLEGGSGEGRCRLALFLGIFDVLDLIGLAVDVSQYPVDALLIGQFLLALLIAEEMGGEVLFFLMEGHINAPVFLGDKGADLPLPIYHHTGDDALDAAGRKAGAHLTPQEGAQLIAHDTVQNPAGLLGIHQIHVDVPGMLDGLGDGGLGDLVKGHTLGLAGIQLQQLLQMPGNGFTFPVRVGCQINELGLVGGILQIVDDLALAVNGQIGGLEVVFHIHAQLLFGQVAQMSHGGLYLIARPQIFGDGLGLGRGLHDEQFCHVFPPFTIKPKGFGQIFS